MKLNISLSTEVVGYTGKNGLYAWTSPDEASIERLRKFVRPLVIEKADLHCTIMYSKSEAKVSVKKVEDAARADFKRAVKLVELTWWEGHDKTGYLVGKFESSALHELHNKWKSMGAVPTFPDYEPHMTLVNPCAMTPKLKKFISDKNAALKSSPLAIALTKEEVSDISQG